MSDADYPAPFVPAEVDLRDFAFMPLDVVRLRDSGLSARATGDEFRAAVLLWCASWHQVPAASLPDDDADLANFCGYSRSPREWAKVRIGALRGWSRCSDGRLYHQVIAEKALEAWIEKLASSIGGATGNAKRWGVAIDAEPAKKQFVQAVDALRTIAPRSRTLRKKVVAVLCAASPPESPPDSGGDSPPDRNRQGQGQGQGQGLEEITPTPDGVGGAPSLSAPTADRPSLTLVEPIVPAESPPDCPHQVLLALWAEVLPAMPQHEPDQWRGARSDHLRTRWRETAVAKRWQSQAEGVTYFRRLFAYVAQSRFLTGRVNPRDKDRPPFNVTLAWLVRPTNWAEVIEGKYHQEAA